jgi:DNA-binding XRE family transcriptional regulator
LQTLKNNSKVKSYQEKGANTLKVFAKNNFRTTRIKKGFSAVTLAEKIGTTKQAIGQIERRVHGCGPQKAKLITEVLGVEFDDVFELVERVNASNE